MFVLFSFLSPSAVLLLLLLLFVAVAFFGVVPVLLLLLIRLCFCVFNIFFRFLPPNVPFGGVCVSMGEGGSGSSERLLFISLRIFKKY